MVQTQKNRIINLALVGYGKWGKNYVKTAKEIPDIRIKYICAPSLTNARVDNDYVIVNDYKELSQFDDIDGVIIASPASTHFAIARYFLKKGINILIEKPLTTRYKDAVTLEKLSKRKKSLVMVGHIDLYNPAFLALKKMMKQIGEISYIDCEGMDWGPFRTDVSALWDWAPHDVAMCLDLIGEPLSVQAWSLSRDNDMIAACLYYPDNVKAFIKIGWLSPLKVRRVLVVGSKKSFLFDDTKKKKVEVFDKQVTYPYYPDERPLQKELEAFVDCIRKKKMPYSNLEKAVKIAHVIDALERSLIRKSAIVTMKRRYKK